jgi:DNA invertase Pin-like site-specific DNA recombinase
MGKSIIFIRWRKARTEEGHEMSTRTAVIYTRVSSREQEQEGFSLEAQSKLLHEYAKRSGFEIVRAFEDLETAKTTGRKEFGEMVSFLKRNRMCRTLLVEKTDRLYRNFRDAVTLEDLNIEIHFVKEGQVLSNDSKSQIKFMHDIRLAVARNYSENLREEVIKGMREKAEQGIYPGRPPLGYRNNRATRTIEINPEKAAIAKYVFERYASGRYSLLALSHDVRQKWGVRISKTNLHKMLLNRFYIGQFIWGGSTYRGKHTPLIAAAMFTQVQDVLHGHNKPKHPRLNIAFRGLLTCAHDNCTVTGEFKKGKYVYYRCSGSRGPCALPSFREQEIAEKLGHLVRDVSIPLEIAHRIVRVLENDRNQVRERVAHEQAHLARELSTLSDRMRAAYRDKLDGKISEDFWQRNQAEWQEEEQRITSRLSALKKPSIDEGVMDVRRVLELAQSAYSLYITKKPAEQAELLRNMLWNCAIDGVNLYPLYKKPFDLIAKRAKNEEWSGREDLNLRPPGPETATDVLTC